MNVEIPHRSWTLSNGLQVLLHEDHGSPIVAVNTWFRVGSKDEEAGRTGLAHLFEHLMFEGSEHVPAGMFDQLLEDVGGVNNGSTNEDRTNYWETVPSNALELALWLDSDRMGWLGGVLTQEMLDNQRDVVKNERRQSYENRPYGLAFETVQSALYEAGHPYRWPTIGYMADLDAATLEDIQAFQRRQYTPRNAILAIAGDATASAVERLVEGYYAEIPAGPVLPTPSVAPSQLATDRTLVLEDEVQLPRVYQAWHSPARFAPGDAEMDVVAAMLAEGKMSRLFRTLVYERQLAQDVSAFQSSGLLGSVFYVVTTARPGVGLEQLHREVRAALRDLAEAMHPSELERARNGILTAFVGALEAVGGFGGKADRLADYAFYAGDPGYATADVARFTDMRLEDARRSVRAFLLDAASVTLSVVPRGRTDLAVGGET